MSSEKRLFLKVAFGKRLAQARTRLQLSQEALAEVVGTSARSIRRWESDQAIPQEYYRHRLCEALQISAEELFAEDDEKQQPVPQPAPLWYVPYTRNPYFVGRESILLQLHNKLHTDHQVSLIQPQILSGLGGIGKTQMALEFVYRFRHEYQAIFWVGAETAETWMADYLALAHLFQLPEKDSLNHSLIITAVKRWFRSHDDWLLVFDNVEDLDLLHKMLPDTSQGHILITTRSQITGALGSHIALHKMEPAEGALLLLKRAKLLSADAPLETASATVRAQADTLVELLDGLPLALDQAAAYIEEAGCRLADYLDLYKARRKDLLSIRGTLSSHHPDSVATTLSLSLQRVEQASPAAADLLRLCAFLHAEAIPEEFFTRARDALGPELHSLSTDPLLFDEAMKTLRRFSLIHREPGTKTLSLHRLLQAILMDTMTEQEHSQWMERIIRAMLQIFPDYNNVMNYDIRLQPDLHRYLSHALVCVGHIQESDLTSLEAEEFIYRVFVYLQLWGDDVQAFPLILQAFQITKKIFGIEHVKSIFYLNELAHKYAVVRQYRKAEEYFHQALTICEKTRGPDHLETAESLWRLANLFNLQGRYTTAESYAQRALTIKEQALGQNHHEVAFLLNILGISSTFQQEHSRAKALFQKAISMYEKTLGEDHFFVATCSRNLGTLYFLQQEYVQATALYQQALQIYEKRLGLHHLSIAYVSHKLGDCYCEQRYYEQAETFYQRALKIYKHFPELDHHVYVAYILSNLAELYLLQGHRHLAKDYLQDACTTLGERLCSEYVDYQEIVHCLLLVGEHLEAQGDLMRAQICYQRTLIVAGRALGSDHPFTVQCRSRLETISLLSDPSSQS